MFKEYIIKRDLSLKQMASQATKVERMSKEGLFSEEITHEVEVVMEKEVELRREHVNTNFRRVAFRGKLTTLQRKIQAHEERSEKKAEWARKNSKTLQSLQRMGEAWESSLEKWKSKRNNLILERKKNLESIMHL